MHLVTNIPEKSWSEDGFIAGSKWLSWSEDGFIAGRMWLSWSEDGHIVGNEAECGFTASDTVIWEY